MADKKDVLAEAISALTAQLSRGTKPLRFFDDDISAKAFVYDVENGQLRSVERVVAPDFSMLVGIDRTKTTLLKNNYQFAAGHSANNALLWGARGMGKSTLVKAIHNQTIIEYGKSAPNLIEIHREDISALPQLLATLRQSKKQFVIFCDDLSFNQPDRDFKALKSVLEGGLEGRPDNVIFYATSNRRHLLPREMADQETAIGIHPNESMDETIALSDRFGLWLGFHAADQAEYIAMIKGYMNHFKLIANHDWEAEALEWSKTRGNRSGRTAWQYVNNLAGKLERRISF